MSDFIRTHKRILYILGLVFLSALFVVLGKKSIKTDKIENRVYSIHAHNDKETDNIYYQKLVKLRHEVSVITDGEYELLDAENEKIYTYLRKGENESLVVAANFTDEEIDYQVDEKVKAQESSLLISNYGDAPDTFNNHLTLKPYQVYVYMIR